MRVYCIPKVGGVSLKRKRVCNLFQNLFCKLPRVYSALNTFVCERKGRVVRFCLTNCSWTDQMQTYSLLLNCLYEHRKYIRIGDDDTVDNPGQAYQ